jgi:hypothetical protein
MKQGHNSKHTPFPNLLSDFNTIFQSHGSGVVKSHKYSDDLSFSIDEENPKPFVEKTTHTLNRRGLID